MEDGILTVGIKIEGLYPLLDAALWEPARDAVVLAAPCTRARSALLAWLMSRALTARRPCLWLSANPGADRAMLERWCEPELMKRLRLIVSGETEYDRLPVHLVEDVVLADADRMPDPAAWLAQRCRGHTRYLSVPPPPGTWLHDMLASAVVHRITAADALAAGATTEEHLARVRATMTPTTYAREYEGQYVSTTEPPQRFNVFARTRLKIRDKGGTIVPFKLRSIQRTYAAIKAIKRKEMAARGLPLRIALLKYRRGGFTTFEQGESYQLTSRRENMQAVTLAHTAKATAQIFRIAQLYYKMDERRPKLKGVGNAHRLEFPELNSQFFIGTASSSGEGRGDTLQRVHGSEVSKWGKGPRRREFVSDLVAGLTEAASHGEVVLETTANGREWFYDTYTAAKNRQNDFTPVFLPWYWDPTYRMDATSFDPAEIRDTLQEDEIELMERHRLALSQIAWRRNKKRALRGLFLQEYPEDDLSCWLTEGLCFFDVGSLLDLMEALPEYPTTEVPSGYVVEWEQPIPGEEYVAGSDTSEGVPGSDPNGTGILHRRTGRQVAALHGVFTPAELAVHSARLCRKYNEAFWGIERNNHGHAVLVHVTNGDSPAYYHNLYYHDDGRAGWVTSPKTRPAMLSDLKEAVEEGYMEIRDRQFLDECRGFVKQRNGKYSGTPDDAVLKWAIAWQMRDMLPEKSDII